MENVANCFYHPERNAVNTCYKCEKDICIECNYVTGTHPICRNCWDKQAPAVITSVSGKPAKRKKAKVSEGLVVEGVKDDLQMQNVGVVAAENHAQEDVKMVNNENTSGQGKASVIPYEIKGWSWGAFLLNWIWGIGNSVWIALLCFIPVVGFIMVFVLGIKGNAWAWQSKRWDSVEHFRKTQKTWMYWGVGVTLVSFAIGVVMALLGVAL